MSKVWSAIVNMVEEKYFDEDMECIVPYREEKHLRQAIEEVLMEHEDTVHYEVSTLDVFDSPAYETGVVYAAWTEGDGSLHTIDYQWECH